MNLYNYIRDIENHPKEGILFKDISPLLENPQAYRAAMTKFEQLFDLDRVDKIAAMDARGFLFGNILAIENKIPFIQLRKKGKLPYHTISESYGLEYGSDELEMHTDSVQEGDRVLLVDDLLATGGTMKAGCNLVEKLRGKVVGCGFLIELLELNGRSKLDGHDVRSILKY